MVIALVLATIVAFVVVDLVIRYVHGRLTEARIRKERESALDIGLRLDYTEDSPSLKRVTVPEPRARILAVDDELEEGNLGEGLVLQFPAGTHEILVPDRVAVHGGIGM